MVAVYIWMQQIVCHGNDEEDYHLSSMSIEKAANIVLRSLTPNRPYHVQWMLTRRCNFRCKGCNVWQEQDTRELSTEKVKDGLDVLRELGVIEVVLTGGNPLLRDDIGEIIEYASRHFITTVYDNGSMAVSKIDALRHADFVAISVDSLSPDRNNYVRGVDNAWQNALKAVDTLHEEGISVSVSPTISQFNLHEIVDFTNHFLEKNIPVWYCLYSYDTPNSASQIFRIGKKNDEFAITDKEAMVEVCDSIFKMRKKNRNVLMTTKLLNALRNLYLTEKRTWKCRALKNFFVVNHLGMVAGCHLHDSVASIFDLPRLWNSAKFEDLREMYRNCTQCTYLCYIFYSLHGSVLGNFQITRDHWRNARMLLKKTSTSPSLATPR